MADPTQELQLTHPPATIERRRPEPTLVVAGNRLVSSDGRFHATLAAQYIREHAPTRWVGVTDLARMFTANTIDGRRRVRRNLFAVLTALLNDGHFLIYEIGKGRRIESVKLLDASSEAERQAAIHQAERMRRRRELSAEKYCKALEVIQLREQLAHTAP